MTENGRRRFNAAIKARVAIEALREQKTAAQITTEFEGHPSQVANLSRQPLEFVDLPRVCLSITTEPQAQGKCDVSTLCGGHNLLPKLTLKEVVGAKGIRHSSQNRHVLLDVFEGRAGSPRTFSLAEGSIIHPFDQAGRFEG